VIVRADSGGGFPLSDGSVQCVVTSPPYWWLRDYGVPGQLGLEATPEEYVERLVDVFREVRRCLRNDGVVFLNLGDSYAAGGRGRGEKQSTNRGSLLGVKTAPPGLKPKDLVGIPWRVAFALQTDGAASPCHMETISGIISAITSSYETRDEWPKPILQEVQRLEREWIDAHHGGWYLRSDIIWSKPNSMPESVKDRPTRAHEYVFLLTKSKKYSYDHEAVRTVARDSSVERQQRGKLANPRRAKQTVGAAQSPDRGEGSIQMQPLLKDKQRGHGRRHEGFNGRWDNMSTAEQMAFGANLRDVWTISPEPSPEEHYAAYPEALVKPCILAGCPEGGVVLDPFVGTGTTVRVAQALNRKGVGLELDPKSCAIAKRRTSQMTLC